MSFMERLRRAREFFRPEKLASTSLAYTPLPDDIKLPRNIALLVIDVQQEFCDPSGERGNEETREVSQRIKSLIPAFRKAGVPVYVIYFSEKARKKKDIDFYEFIPDKDDFIVRKRKDSAFQGSNINKMLKRDQRRLLLTCGFNLNACVFDTVMDACGRGYAVRLLRDLTGNDNNNDAENTERYLKRMRDRGVIISSSENELKALEAAPWSNQECDTQEAPQTTPRCRPRRLPEPA